MKRKSIKQFRIRNNYLEVNINENDYKYWDQYIETHNQVIMASEKNDNTYAASLIKQADSQFTVKHQSLEKLINEDHRFFENCFILKNNLVES